MESIENFLPFTEYIWSSN